jgi:hypothetical protein
MSLEKVMSESLSHPPRGFYPVEGNRNIAVARTKAVPDINQVLKQNY